MSPSPDSPAPSAPPSSQHGKRPALDPWPRQPELLTDTTLCPACFSAIAILPRATHFDGSPGPVCTACGLDLSAPEAADLLNLGAAVVRAEYERRGLLERMRTAQTEQQKLVTQARQAAASAAYQPQASALPEPPHFYPPESQYPATFGNAPAAQRPPLSPTPPGQGAKARRSGVQILMLSVGVILVSIMALFFVLVAYLVASLEVRSVLTGVASVAVFGIAVLLHRRRLTGTAEGIAALAVVLFLLDLWIIRANGVFGSAAIDLWLYTGVSVGVLTAILALASRAIPLRALSLSAVLLGPVACFALVQGVLVDVDPWTRAWAAFTIVGLASLVWTRVFRPLERTVLRIGGMLAVALAGFCAFGAFPDLPAGASIAFSVLAGAWLCTLIASPAPSSTAGADAAPPSRLDAWQVLAAAGLGLAASGTGVSLFMSGRIEDAVIWLPATVTAIAALVVACLVRVPGLSRLVPAFRVAAAIPLGVAGLACAPALAFSFAMSGWGATTGPFSVDAFGSPANPPVQMAAEAPLALVLVSGIGLCALAVLGRVRPWAWLPAGIGGLGLIAASASIGQPVASALCLGFLAAAFLAGIVVLASASLRIALGLVFGVAVVVFGTIGLTSAATFPLTAVASVALLAAARQVIVRVATGPTTAVLAPLATGSAAVALILSARMVPGWFDAVTGANPGNTAPALWTAVAALLVGFTVPFAAGALARGESAVLTVVAALAVASSLVELFALDGSVPLLTVISGSAVACGVWQFVGRVSTWPERFIAASCAPLATVWAVDVAWREFRPLLPSETGSADSSSVVLAATIVLLAALGVVLFRRREGRPGTSAARVAWDGALALAATIVIVLVSIRPQLGWLALVLLAVAALLVASGDGDIVAGHSPRRHVAWLGLPLSVAGLWLGLARADATVVEFYTLPVAGLLLGILGVSVARRPVPDAVTQPGRSALLAAALAIGIGPSAIVGTGGEPLRAVVVLAASAVLIGVGAAVRPVYRGLLCSALLWGAGVVAASVVGAGRASLEPDAEALAFEVWSATGAVLVLAAGLLWHRNRRAPTFFATVAVVASVLVLTLPTLLHTANIEPWRGLAVLLVICGCVIVASVRDEFSPVLRWVSIACAAVLAGALLATGNVDPFELATVPLALALIAGGAVRLSRDSARGSWAELGPGLVVLLVPSLAANVSTSNELWRVVALGVVALLVLGAGLALKLQAPTILGATVVVAHALAQLWPWISGLYSSVPLWLWGGIGGVILIVLAATYESRIRNLRAVARGVSSLR